MDLDVSAQVQKTHRWPCHPPLPPPALAFVASPMPDYQVHAIAANSDTFTAVDKRRRKVVGTSIQIKRIINVMKLTDTAHPSDIDAL